MNLLEVIGYLDEEPIWLMSGAEPDDDEDENENENEDEDEEEETEEEEERKHPKSGKKEAKPKKEENGWNPPSFAEWKKTQAALKKANETQAAQRKAALEKARKEGMDEAAAKARQEALEEQDARYQPMIVRKEARSLLVEAGCKNPQRFMSLIDLKNCTLDDDGEVLGLEEQINGIKADFPESFKAEEPESKRKSAPSAKKVSAAAGSKKADEPDPEKRSGAHRIADRLLGSGSRG